MVRKMFYVEGPSNANVLNWHRQGQMQIKVPSRPPTALSLISETLVSKKDMESMYTWAFGAEWRMTIDWDDIECFVETKKDYFFKNIGIFEIMKEEWVWNSNKVSQHTVLILIIHKIWTYFKNKGSHHSIKMLTKNYYEKTILHTAEKIRLLDQET